MQRQRLVVIVSGILLVGLGVGWAASALEPPPPPDDPEFYETLSRYSNVENAHIDASYGDCTLGFEHDGFTFVNVSSNIVLNCGISLGGGSGGGGTGEHPSLLGPDYDRPHDYVKWERDGIEFCSLETNSHVRPAENGPNTLLITINCWWFDDQKEMIVLNSTLPDLPLDLLADEASHAILGVVTQINHMPQNLTGSDQTVFTDVVIAVNENLKGSYDGSLLTIRFEGGETEDLVVVNEDAPRFEVGEIVFVLVMEPEPDSIHDDIYSLAGLYQGKYTIGKDGFAQNMDYDRNSSLENLRALFEADPAGNG